MPQDRPFEADVARALDAIGVEASAPALDALVDPGGACAALDALDAGAHLALRGVVELGEGTDEAGPDPRDPFWMGLTRGEARVRLASLRLAERDRGAAADERVALAVVIGRFEEPCCDAGSCSAKKTRASATLELSPGRDEPARVIVAESVALDADAASDSVRAVGGRLARVLGVPLRDGDPTNDAAAIEVVPAPTPAATSPLPAAVLARYGLAREGTRFVLRDYGSDGPRDGVRSKRIVSAVAAVTAAGLWILAARALRTEGTLGEGIGFAAVAALFTLTAYAFFAVARYSNAYGARSAPVVAVGRDRLVVQPWVSRTGAVDRRPEGRFGAALPIAEIRSVAVDKRADAFAVALDTDHGPFDALTTPHEELAALLVVSLRQRIEAAAHPTKGASARQRFRARAQGVPQGRPAT